MNKNIRKRVLIALLAMALMTNCIYVPGNVPTVWAQKITSSEDAASQTEVSASKSEKEEDAEASTADLDNKSVDEDSESDDGANDSEGKSEEEPGADQENVTEKGSENEDDQENISGEDQEKGSISGAENAEDIEKETATEGLEAETAEEPESMEEPETETLEASETTEEPETETAEELDTTEEPETETVEETEAIEETETETQEPEEILSPEEQAELIALREEKTGIYLLSQDSEEIWIEGFEKESDELVYTGEKITQDIKVYDNGTLLTIQKDYTLTYRNNIQAAEYNSLKAPSVTVRMRGEYSGSRTLYFTIAPREIDEEQTLGYEQVVYYSKDLTIPVPTVYYGTKKLTVNKDFVCDYSSLPEKYTKGDSYELGTTYEYTVNGIGNFTGSFIMELSVVKDQSLDFTKAVITLDQSRYEYHGEALTKSDVGISSIKIGKNILDESLYDYQVLAENAGIGYVQVYPSEAGIAAGYRGMQKLAFKVVGDRKLRDTDLGEAWQETLTFSQKELSEKGGICQEKTGVLVYGEGDEADILTQGTDYTVSYWNHKKTGRAMITFTGKGRYTGNMTKIYRILPNTELEIEWTDVDESGAPIAYYQKSGAQPQFQLLEAYDTGESFVLSNKKDYTVRLSGNKKLGTMTCEITGKGNYKGYSSTTELTVIPGDISKGTMTVEDMAFRNDPEKWKADVVITDIDGKKLTAGVDYDKELTYFYEGMEEETVPQIGTTVSVTVQGIAGYEGSSIEGSYHIYQTHLKDLIVVIDDQAYTGEAVELLPEAIHVYGDKNDLKEGIELPSSCYDIVGYSNNINTGKAKVTLRGLGEYGGSKTYSFNILKKELLTTRVTDLKLDETDLSMGVGNVRQLTVTILPEDAFNKTIIWSTSDSEVASVNSEGIVTAKKTGKATIKAVSQDSGKEVSCKIKVSVIPVTSLTLNEEKISQDVGTSFRLEAGNIEPYNATLSTIKWESADTSIASVDENGLVSFHSAGMTVVKAYVNESGFAAKCVVIVNGENANEPEVEYLTPQMFRSADDEDDTAAFNTAIKNLTEDCNTLYVPSGTYKIDAKTSVRLVSNMNLIMEPDAVLQAINNSYSGYKIIYANNIKNVTITGGQVIGDRYGHTGTSGEWGMGIGVYDSKWITISNVQISRCWGDGIYIGSNHEEDSIAGCNYITVNGCKIFLNRRNNMSIVCGDNVTVTSCTFKNANGTAPEYGIDIEPNVTRNPCEGIVISDCTFSGNAQAAMGIITSANDVTISGCTMNGMFLNYAGTNVTLTDTTVNGEVDARVPIFITGTTVFNDGSSTDDQLKASFSAATGSFTLDKMGINDSNQMASWIKEDENSPSGKVLHMERVSTGNQNAGYYLNLSDFTVKSMTALDAGTTYRFEYVVKGTGQWGIKTNQTGWYPCLPMEDQYATGVVTYKANAADAGRLMLYAVDYTNGMYLDVDSIKIYKVR